MKKILSCETEPICFHTMEDSRKTYATSSKGNQVKWYLEEKDIYVKADLLGYEGLAEYLSYKVATYTNLNEFAPVTAYELCEVYEDMEEIKKRYAGCYSKSFIKKGETIITAERLFQKHNATFLGLSLEERIEAVVDFLIKVTKIKNIGEWITALLEFDLLILNDDRHFNNIAFILSEDGQYRLAPLFDNGAGFCSDMIQDYPINLSIEECIKNVLSKPFSINAFNQVKACRRLYGSNLKVNLYPDDIESDQITHLYHENINKRAINILKTQLEQWHFTYKQHY